MSISEALRAVTCAAVCVLYIALLPSRGEAQQLDATVWWGTSHSSDGPVIDERFEVQTRGTETVILRASFGKTPVSWGSVEVNRVGAIEFHWAGDSSFLCIARQTDSRNYEGTCRQSGHKEWPLMMSKNQPSHGLAIPVSDLDFRILRRARQILAAPSVWNRHDTRYCDDAAEQKSWSLFCSLYQASFEVSGAYTHLRPVMEEVRASVYEVAIGKTLNQPLKDFNNLESIGFTDIANVFTHAERRLETRRACSQGQTSHWSVDKRYTVPVAREAIPAQQEDSWHWGEGLVYSTQKQIYRLTESLGPMIDGRRPPAEWLTASRALSGRMWKQKDLEGLDVAGELPDGNRWRYFSLCGESWMYYDVPADAANFFNSVIDSAYSVSVARSR